MSNASQQEGRDTVRALGVKVPLRPRPTGSTAWTPASPAQRAQRQPATRAAKGNYFVLGVLLLIGGTIWMYRRITRLAGASS
jgi:hypothetical protein